MPDIITEKNQETDHAVEPALSLDGNVPYDRMFRHTSLFGGVMGVNMLINMGRMKLMAELVGANGVGQYGMYMGILYSIQAFITLSLSTSGVRDIAEAFGRGNPRLVAHTYRVVRRILMVMGIAGGIFLFIWAPQMSRQVFGDESQILPIRLLALTFFFYNFFTGQEAVLQGVHRPADAARASVIGNLISALCTVFLLWEWGARGIIPALVLHYVFYVGVGCFFTKKLTLPMDSRLSWRRTFYLAKGMVYLGLSITVTGTIYNFVSLWIRSYILEKSGEATVGYYTAAFSVCIYAVVFVASSLSMEFFPMLAVLKGKSEAFSRLVNRQVEVLVLIVAPFFLTVMVFSDMLFPLFYSQEFVPAIGAFRWFLVGAMAQLISWPMGLIRYAHKWVWLTLIWEILSCALNVGLVLLLYPVYGLEGAGMAFAFLRILEYVVNLMVGHYWLGYNVSRGAFLISSWAMGSFLLCYALLHWVGIIPAVVVFVIAVIGMLRSAKQRFYHF